VCGSKAIRGTEMKTKLSKTDFNAKIKNAQFQRNRLFITFFLTIPYMFLLVYLDSVFPKPIRSEWLNVLFAIAIAFPFVFYGYCGIRLLMAKCPRCGKQVYMRWLPLFFAYSNAFSRKCLNCGLEMEVRK
jgi:hypothetical protein